MLGCISQAEHIYLACGYTDMRKSIDGLAALVQQNFKTESLYKHSFSVLWPKSLRLKALYWEGNGFVMLYKRLESGKFQWPRTEEEVRQISTQEFRWLMEGLSINQPKAVKKLSIKNTIWVPKNADKHWIYRCFCVIINTIKSKENFYLWTIRIRSSPWKTA